MDQREGGGFEVVWVIRAKPWILSAFVGVYAKIKEAAMKARKELLCELKVYRDFLLP